MDQTRYDRRMKQLQAEIDKGKQPRQVGGLTPTYGTTGIGLQDLKKLEAEAKARREAMNQWPGSMFKRRIRTHFEQRKAAAAIPFFHGDPQRAAELKQVLEEADQLVQNACGMPQPPSVRPRKMVDAARRQEIEEAIAHRHAAKAPIPIEWELELAELVAGDNLRQLVGLALRARCQLIAVYDRRGKSVAPFLMRRAEQALREAHDLRGMELESVWLDEASGIESGHRHHQERIAMDSMKTDDMDHNKDPAVTGPSTAKAMPDMEHSGSNPAASRGHTEQVSTPPDQGALDNMRGKL